jgi:hypothetical protein
MKRIRTSMPKIRHGRPAADDLPEDPRDPDVVRAKALARAVFHELHADGRNALCSVCDGQYRDGQYRLA